MRLHQGWLVPAWMLAFPMVMISAQVKGDEPLFGYVYTTDLLPGGKFELAQWATYRSGKPVGQFDVLEGQTEFEYGLTDRIQVSAYLNYAWARAYHDNVIDGTTLPPASMAAVNVGPNDRLNTTRFTGLSFEGIFRVLSPYTDPLGLAIYVKPTVGPELRELESRMILQKNFHDDRLVFAFNLTNVDDRRYLPVMPGRPDSGGFDHPWTEQSTLNLGLAASYRFARSWSAGLELQNERGFSGLVPFSPSARTGAAFYLGPSLHYAGQHGFTTLTYLDQLPLGSDDAHSDPDFIVAGRDYSAAFERSRIRVKFGWYF